MRKLLKVQIRPMTKLDWLFQGTALSHIWTKEQHRKWFTSAVSEYINSGSRRASRVDGIIVVMLKAERSATQCIGVSGWYPTVKMGGEKIAVMRWHGILEHYRNSGLSKLLLNWVCKDAAAHGYKAIYELSESDEARDYFIKNGFVLTDEPDIDDNPFKYVMKKEIGNDAQKNS